MQTKRKRASPWLIFSGLCFSVLFALLLLSGSILSASNSVIPYPRGQPEQGLVGEHTDYSDMPIVDWNYWSDVNPDIIAWITVPGTSIDYAIVQAPRTDPTYYLNHDIYGTWSPLGCPYIDAECSGLDSLNTYIFGHHISYGNPIFADFAKFSNKDFAANHQTIYLQSPHRQIVLEVSAVDIIRGNEASRRTDIEDVDQLRKWYLNRFDSSLVKLGNDEDMNQLFTFVTCSYNYFSNERTLVHAQILYERNTL